MRGEGVGLWAVGLPVGGDGGVKEGSDAAGGFGGGDVEGGERVDEAEGVWVVEGRVVVADCCRG